MLVWVDDLGRLPLPVRVSAFDLVGLRDELGAPGGSLGIACAGLSLLSPCGLALLGLLDLLVPRHVGDVLDAVD